MVDFLFCLKPHFLLISLPQTNPKALAAILAQLPALARSVSGMPRAPEVWLNCSFIIFLQS
jgi:hypothetical protein